jgi:hypothetical protein
MLTCSGCYQVEGCNLGDYDPFLVEVAYRRMNSHLHLVQEYARQEAETKGILGMQQHPIHLGDLFDSFHNFHGNHAAHY